MRHMRNGAMIVACVVAAVMSGCGEHEKPARGVVVLDDMGHTPAHKSQTALSVTRSGTASGTLDRQVPTGLTPPAMTVARGEWVVATNPADPKAAASLANPLLPTADVLIRGRHHYQIQCGVCHGMDGDSSHAPMARYFAGIPTIKALTLAGLSDGELFHIITHGKPKMPSLAAQLPVQDRWAVIHYLRTLARTNVALTDREAMLADVAAASYSSTAAVERVVEDHGRDRTLIQRGGGEAFVPPKRSDPKHAPPAWDDAKSDAKKAQGH